MFADRTRKKELEKEEKRLEYIPCKKCSNTRDPILLEDIVDSDPDLFMFEQDNYCYCFLVYSLYQAVFGTDIPTDKEPLKPVNPLTGSRLGNDVIRELKLKYKKWYKNPSEFVVDNITINNEDIDSFKKGVNTIIDMVQSEYRKEITEQEASKRYIEDLIDLFDEDSEEVIKAKAIYKHLNN